MRIVIKNLPLSTTEKEISSHFSMKSSPVTDVFMLMNTQNKFRRICFVGYSTTETAIEAQAYFNQTYFKNHKITVELAVDTPKPKTETQSRRALYSRRIVIRNVPQGMTEDEIQDALQEYGTIQEVEMSKESAIVKFKRGEDAEKALNTLKVLKGKRVRVGNYMEKVVDTLKEHYNTLFFDFETVSKATTLIKDSSVLKDKELGPKVALLETSLVEETKKFLEQNGIFLDRISGKSKKEVIVRSPDLFGVLDMIEGEFTVKIAPTKVLAIVKFREEGEAEKCYRKLNMRRHKNGVIHCEYCPLCENVGSDVIIDAGNIATRDKTTTKIPKILVRNVPFQATKEDLLKLFSCLATVKEVRLPKKADGNHRGFGFIVMDSLKSVTEAIEYFGSSTHLYGRRLVLEQANQ